jgi:hypothetical protein
MVGAPSSQRGTHRVFALLVLSWCGFATGACVTRRGATGGIVKQLSQAKAERASLEPAVRIRRLIRRLLREQPLHPICESGGGGFDADAPVELGEDPSHLALRRDG